MIALGYAFSKAGIIDAAAGRGITLFVFNVAIPALLFKTVAALDSDTQAPWSLWLVFFGGIAIVWLVTIAVARAFPSLAASGGAAASMATGFGNLVMLGTPLALAHFGEEAAVPLGMILSVHAPILWFAATLHREIARHSGGFALRRSMRELLVNLATNAIVLALLGGTLWRVTGIGFHPVASRMFDMLAEASVPTALFALGVSLAGYALRGSFSGMFAIIGLKMVLLPAVVFALARYATGLPPLWIKLTVLFAAMPTGANAFLFAQRNEESVPAVSGAIALGTALAALSAVLLLYLMDAGLI